MAKVCIQCDKKLGFFQTPIDNLYCSHECKRKAKAEAEENERKADERVREANALAAREAAEKGARDAAAAAEAERRGTCPKCGKRWTFTPIAGAGALAKGECGSCGFAVECLDVEKCPGCHALSLVVHSADDARCPRCKHKRQGSARR